MRANSSTEGNRFIQLMGTGLKLMVGSEEADRPRTRISTKIFAKYRMPSKVIESNGALEYYIIDSRTKPLAQGPVQPLLQLSAWRTAASAAGSVRSPSRTR